MRTLLGLGAHQEDIGDLRQLQLAPLRGKGSLRLSMGIGMAFVAAFTMITTRVALPVASGWLAVMLLFGLLSYRAFAKLPLGDPKLQGGAEFHMCNRHAFASAVLWILPFWLQGGAPGLDHSLAMWAIALLMMLTLAMIAHSVPSTCLLFIVPVSLSAAIALIRGGAPQLAGVALVAGLLLCAFSLRFAQSYIRFRRAEEVLHEKSETVSLLLREFEETSADWLWQTDNARRLIHVSPRLAYALGSSAEALEGLPLLQALAGDAWETGQFPKTLHDMAERMKRRESFSNLIVPVTIGGKPRWWELSASPRLDDQGKYLGFRGVGSDVTEQRASAEQIARMARFDNLTGLPNRLHLTENLGRALGHATEAKTRCALMILDLDRFKAVNDTLGHPVGDKLLAQVAARLKSMMEPGMTCGRLGGDEFAVVLPNVQDAKEAEDLAHRIIATLSRPYVVDNHQLFVGASVGYAMGPQDGATVETLTRNADLALYKSKDKGGNVVAPYVPSLHAQAEERRVMEQELRGALDRGEFELYYQPVVTAEDGTLNGFEALIRWTNQTLGNVSPGRFIPLAEDSRLIAPIGEWVLRTACAEAMRWPSNLKVAINVSAEQLTDPNFAAVVVSALAQSGLPPQRLEIEVTESVFLRDGGGAAQLLDQLIALGIRLSLDDFGTGYSSLGYLRKTQFSTIKVDRTFVVGAAKGATESIAIIRAVVALADSLGMSTTAEGAETELEVETIRTLGCSNIQGYYYGRPMPASDVLALFRPPDSLPCAAA
ncbi:putative bifunctional diguanylate cyclase/phosphodiesterase [Sphingopyxis panaciterrulae]|uniref:Diguanylate cyclase (GGDEF)-like protein/PAS domain S-box-containing protein n=1 Tax=Sphingopyxis panaciterrulae TaxID=462372 RepID=A0A7W9EPK4_9SPHN|nr:diguanylate cyclase (GGDEF)-like protein/PAS domain S-box-containing protein [Sphingopyxis panaciterrulae]